MDKIRIEICLGTTCYVLGSASLVDVENRLPKELAGRVEVIGSHCLETCHNRNYGDAPFVRVGRRVIGNASIERILEALFEELEKETDR